MTENEKCCPEEKTPCNTSKMVMWVLALVLVGVGGYMAGAKKNGPEDATATADSQVNQDQVKAIVAEYIADNPKAIMDAVNDYQRQQAQAQLDSQRESIRKFVKTFEEDTTSPMAGNPDGDVVVVEFFDYNCGYCKRAMDDVMTLLDEEKNIKFLFKEFPILSPSSETAARAALAVNKLDKTKYLDYHNALMRISGPITEDKLLEIAAGMGLEKDAVKTAMNGDDVSKMLEDDRNLGRELGIRGTPAFIVGDTIIPGAVGVEQLKTSIMGIRAERKQNAEKPAAME